MSEDSILHRERMSKRFANEKQTIQCISSASLLLILARGIGTLFQE